MRTIVFFVVALLLCGTAATAQSRYHNRHDYGRYYNYPPLPRTAVVIPFGSYNYRYANGYFYRPFGASIRVVAPPIGIYINILPRGYRTIYYPGGLCYYYNGIYYRDYNNRYEVIEAPIGARVPQLLPDAKTVVVNNEKLYEMNGTYYKEEINSNGDINYKVVGKNGEVTREKDVASTQLGDKIERLPDGSKAIVINGKKLYVSPTNDYYEEVVEGNNLEYKMVGNEVK
jgi:hypothetical protein